MNITITDQITLVAFWLAFTRWLMILMQLPLFDNVSVPNLLKILFSLIITYAFFPGISPYIRQDIMIIGPNNFWVLTIFYTLVGLIIGYMVKAIMYIFYAAGSVISQQVGFSAMSYFDPSAAQRVGPFEKIIRWVVVITILSSGALLPMFKGIYLSFSSIQLHQITNFQLSPEYYLKFFKSVFATAFLLASPCIFTNIMLTLVMGIIARTVPQMNVLMVHFVVNIGIGLFVFAIIQNEFFHTCFKIYTDWLGTWFNFYT